MDFSILYAIQNLRCDFLDRFILLLTKVMGSNGQSWLVLAGALLIFRKTRKCGIGIIISYAMIYLVGQFGLKDLIARPRPCNLDESVELLIQRPSSFSCPSTHSGWAFAAATDVLLRFRKAGIITMIAAVLIGFSRMYLFVHFPTDVLFGAILGVFAGIAATKLVNLADTAIRKRRTAN